MELAPYILTETTKKLNTYPKANVPPPVVQFPIADGILNFNEYLKMLTIYSLALIGFGIGTQKSYGNNNKNLHISQNKVPPTDIVGTAPYRSDLSRTWIFYSSPWTYLAPQTT